MGCVEVQYYELRALAPEELDFLRGRVIGHGVVNGIAIGDGFFKLRDEIGLGGDRFLDFGFLRFPLNPTTKEILVVGDMADDLAERANFGGRLEGVVIFGHFFGSLRNEAFDDAVEEFAIGGERVLGLHDSTECERNDRDPFSIHG